MIDIAQWKLDNAALINQIVQYCTGRGQSGATMDEENTAECTFFYDRARCYARITVRVNPATGGYDYLADVRKYWSPNNAFPMLLSIRNSVTDKDAALDLAQSVIWAVSERERAIIAKRNAQ